METNDPMTYEEVLAYVNEQLDTVTDTVKRATLFHLSVIAKSQGLSFFWSEEQNRPYYKRKKVK